MSLKRLARSKGISVATVYRAARGQGDCRVHTATLLTAALIEEERRLFDHLQILHGGGQTAGAVYPAQAAA